MAAVTTEYKVTIFDKNDDWKDQHEWNTLDEALADAKDIEVGESAQIDRVRSNRVANVSKPVPVARVTLVK